MKCLAIIISMALFWIESPDWEALRIRMESGANLSNLRDDLKAMDGQDHPELCLLMTELCLKLDDEKTAIDYGRCAVEALPNSPQAKYHLAMALERKMSKNPMTWMTGKGEYLELLSEARALDPQFVAAYLGTIGFYSNAPSFVGGSMKKAHLLADDLIKQDPVQGRLAKANLHAKEKEWDKATGLMQELLSTNPADKELRFRYGRLLQDKGDFKQADEQFALGFDDAEWGRQCLYQAARSKVIGQYQQAEAIELLDRYLTLVKEGDQPDAASALWRKGNALEQLGNKAEAKRSYEKAIVLNPNMKEAIKDLKKLNQED